jgi:putative sterol carrier protein
LFVEFGDQKTMVDAPPSAPFASLTLKEIEVAMKQAVAMDEDVKRKFNATVLFTVDGESFPLNALSTSSTANATESEASKNSKNKYDLRVKTSTAILRDILAKKLTPQQAFLKGKLKIKGKMSLAMKLTLVVDATRTLLERQLVARL